MNTKVSAYNLSISQQASNISIKIPSPCPNCKTVYAGLPLISYLVQGEDEFPNSILYSIFFCPHCDKCFMVIYTVTGLITYETQISEILPHPDSYKDFSSEIKDLSPKFIEIYSQAEKAENCGLSEICGLGYRKALEFLIKDYAISLSPENEIQIKAAMLSPCINEYIDNDRIQTLAKASAWIGNDETHYIRKHEDYNLDHLKVFISTVVTYIDSELTYQKAKLLITSPKK